MRLALVVPLAAAPVCAQQLEDVRAAARDAARSSHYAAFLAGFVGLTGESELSGANLRIDDELDTEITLLTYPMHREVPLGDGDDGLRLRLEADFGYAKARFRSDDIYGGDLPGFETRVRSRYEAFGGFGGVGFVVPIGDVTVAPIVVGGITRVDTDTFYDGAGAAVAQQVLDGILFNWNATYAVYGGGLLLQHRDFLLGDVRITPRLRYDARRTDPLSADDPVQDEASPYEWSVARIDLDGPAGWDLQGRPVRWTGELGYKRFLDEVGDLLGFEDYFELGAGLRWNARDLVPLVGDCGLGGALLIGDDVLGWTFGVTMRF